MRHARCSHCKRARLIESEALIDLDEWAELHGHPAPFTVPSGITADLWHKLERVPFRTVIESRKATQTRAASDISIEARLLRVVSRARALAHHELHAAGSQHTSARVVRFAASLSAVDLRAHELLAMHVGPCSDHPRVVTIGLARESAWLSALSPPLAAAAKMDASHPVLP